MTLSDVKELSREELQSIILRLCPGSTEITMEKLPGCWQS